MEEKPRGWVICAWIISFWCSQALEALLDGDQGTNPPSSTDGLLWNGAETWFPQGSLRSGSLLQELLDEARKAERISTCINHDHQKERLEHWSPQRENPERNERKAAFWSISPSVFSLWNMWNEKKTIISDRMKCRTETKEVCSFHFGTFSVVETHGQLEKVY